MNQKIECGVFRTNPLYTDAVYISVPTAEVCDNSVPLNTNKEKFNCWAIHWEDNEYFIKERRHNNLTLQHV